MRYRLQTSRRDYYIGVLTATLGVVISIYAWYPNIKRKRLQSLAKNKSNNQQQNNSEGIDIYIYTLHLYFQKFSFPN